MQIKHINIKKQWPIISIIIIIVLLFILSLILHQKENTKLIFSSGLTATVTLLISYRELHYKHKSTIKNWNHRLNHFKNEHNNTYEYQLRIRLERIQSELLNVFFILDNVYKNIYIYSKYGMTSYLRHIKFNTNSYYIVKLSKAMRLLNHINFKIEWALEIATFLCYRKKYSGSSNKKELINCLTLSRRQSYSLIINIHYLLRNNKNKLTNLNKIKSEIYSKQKGTIIKNIRNARYASQYLDIK